MTKEFLKEQVEKATEIAASEENPLTKLNRLAAMSDNLGLFAIEDKLCAPEETDILQKKLDSLMNELRKDLPV